VSDEVDLTGAIGIPKVDGQDIEGCIDFVDIDLLFRLGISHDQSDTGWWRDRSPILITKTTHPSANRLLYHMKRPDATLMDGRDGSQVIGCAQGARSGSRKG
jgi:hypothetical protein